jgi:hypothetical protein
VRRGDRRKLDTIDVREAQGPDVDLVILASHDSDLDPAFDEVLALGSAKIQTFSWYDPAQPHRIQQLRPRRAGRGWPFRLGSRLDAQHLLFNSSGSSGDTMVLRLRCSGRIVELPELLL